MRCGDVQTQAVAALRHRFQRWRTVLEAACGQEGRQERACAHCGAVEARPLAALRHWPGRWQTVQEPTAYVPGLQHKACRRCGAVMELRPLRYPFAYFAVPVGPWSLQLAGIAEAQPSDGLYAVKIPITPGAVSELPLLARNRYHIGTLRVAAQEERLEITISLFADNSRVIRLQARAFAGWDSVTPARLRRLTRLTDSPELTLPRETAGQPYALLVFRAEAVFDTRRAENVRLPREEAAALGLDFAPDAMPQAPLLP